MRQYEGGLSGWHCVHGGLAADTVTNVPPHAHWAYLCKCFNIERGKATCSSSGCMVERLEGETVINHTRLSPKALTPGLRHETY